jgi:hypothetical protein
VDVAAVEPHPTKNNTTNTIPTICCSSDLWFILRPFHPSTCCSSCRPTVELSCAAALPRTSR